MDNWHFSLRLLGIAGLKKHKKQLLYNISQYKGKMMMFVLQYDLFNPIG